MSSFIVTYQVDVAVRRSVLTGVGQTCREIGIMNAEENDCDLMELSVHFGARPTHAEWQGQIVSLSGRKGYLSLSDIGYGTGDGFGGWNCRHDWFPYFEGYSSRNYTDSYLKSLNEKNIEYNGEKYSQYEISQIQRRYEREIRSAKREKVAFDTAVKDAPNEQAEKFLKEGLNDAKQNVREKQAQMRDFIQQTGNKRDYFREQNYGKVIYTKNSGNPLTFGSNNGKINSILDCLMNINGFENLSPDIESSLEKAVSVIPKDTMQVISNFVNKITVIKGRKYSSYNRILKEIILDEDSGAKSIIHELGHAFGDAYNLYSDEKFLSILADGLKLDNWNDVIYIPHPFKNDFVYILDADKFISKYQGRIYAEDVIFDEPIKPEWFREYISVGFETFFNNPDILKEHDLKLYNFLKELIK